MRRFLLWFGAAGILLVLSEPLHAAPPLEGVKRVVFLGDSITYAGQYIEDIDAYLRVRYPGTRCELLDLGLPSETVSGLSEPGHAGGKFPRPDVHERLVRVLDKARPDLVVACYGMNCGIYYPFGNDRFEKYQQGMKELREKAAAVGAKVLHVTPPVFDPVPIKARTLPAGLTEYKQPYEGYNEVLDRYSEWLWSQRANGWDVVDIHGPMNRYLAEQRTRDPSFRLAGDGVHIDANGHWLIARQILEHLGVPTADLADKQTVEQALAIYPHGLEVLKLVQQRQRLLKDAWLTATEHKRPGMKQGLPLEEAQKQATVLDEKIAELVKNR
jgi:lysophospholipase L1-like esterase